MINQARMDEITDGDKQVEKELLSLFLQTTESVLGRLQAGGDWQKIVHELKGASVNIGMDDLEKACAEVEHKNLGPEEKKAFFAVIDQHITYLHTLIA